MYNYTQVGGEAYSSTSGEPFLPTFLYTARDDMRPIEGITAVEYEFEICKRTQGHYNSVIRSLRLQSWAQPSLLGWTWCGFSDNIQVVGDFECNSIDGCPEYPAEI
jgi:hypothetical protein